MNLLLPLVLTILLTSCSFLQNNLKEVRADRDDSELLKVRWAKNLDPDYETGNLPIALQSPLVYEGAVYVGHNRGDMISYDLSNGREIWKKNDSGTYHTGAVVHKDVLIYGTTQGRLVARKLLNGELKYSVDLGAGVESTPSLNNDRLYVQTRNHQIFSLDAATGKVLWSYKRSVPYITTLQRVSSPVVFDGKLYVGFADGYIVAFSIDDGVVQWEQKIASGTKFVDVDATPYFHRGNLLIGSMAGPLMVLNPITGATIRQIELSISRAPFPVSGDRLLILTTDGEAILFDSDLKEIRKSHLSNAALSSAVVWKESLIISSVKGEIFVLDPQSFTLIEKRELGHSSSAVFGNIATGEKFLSVLSSRNRLYIYQ